MVFITGATGYVGRYVLQQLCSDRNISKIKVLARKPGDIARLKALYPRMRFIEGDLGSEEKLVQALKGEKVVVHLAACLHGHPDEMIKSNVTGVSNLVSACRKNRIKRIIFLSSMSVSRPYLDDYARTKRKGEEIVKASGMDYVIIRPTMIFGGSGGSFDDIVRVIDSAPFFIPVFGSGKYTLAPVHAEDVARAVVMAAAALGRYKGVYEIAGGKLSFNEFVSIVRERYKLRKRVIHIPIFIARICAFLVSFLKNPPISNAMIMNTTTSTGADTERFIKDFGFIPRSFRGFSDAI